MYLSEEKRFLPVSDFLPEAPQQPHSLHMSIPKPNINKGRLGQSFKGGMNVGRGDPLQRLHKQPKWESKLMPIEYYLADKS